LRRFWVGLLGRCWCARQRSVDAGVRRTTSTPSHWLHRDVLGTFRAAVVRERWGCLSCSSCRGTLVLGRFALTERYPCAVSCGRWSRPQRPSCAVRTSLGRVTRVPASRVQRLPP